MSERGRVIAIFAVVGLLALGGGYYFFGIYRPQQDLKNAQAEIASWEARWQGARDCLLGKSPPTAKTSDALAIHEMAPDPWDRGSCTKLIGKLTRGDSADTGIPAIEKAWGELDSIVSKTAAAFATHITSSTIVLDDPLPAALDALDAARAKLRTAAKLPDTQRSTLTLPVAQIIPIMIGGAPVTLIDLDTLPSAHGMVVFGRIDGPGNEDARLVQIAFTAGGEPKVSRITPNGLRSVPDASWGAIADSEDIRAGAFDPDGSMPRPGEAQSTFPLTDQPTVAVAIGTPANGTLVFGNATSLTIAHSTGNGITAGAPTPIAWAAAATDVDGRAVLLWETQDHQQLARIMKPGDDGTPVPITGLSDARPCLTLDRGWVQRANEVLVFGEGQPLATHDTGRLTLCGCSGDTAVFCNLESPKTVLLCTNAECQPAQLPTAAPDEAALSVVKGRLVAVAAYGRVLGVWRGGMAPTFYALPQPALPLLRNVHASIGMTDGKVIDMLAQTVEGYVLIRVPAA